MVVVWFNGISGTRGQFRDIEKDCIAAPCLWGLRGSDWKMCGGVFLRQKTAVIVVLLFVGFFVLVATQSFGAEAPTHSILPRFQEDEVRVGQAKIQADIAEIPLSFIANAGPADANVRFMVKAGKQTIFFTSQEVVFAASEQIEDGVSRSSVVSRGKEFLVGNTDNE